MIRQDMEPLTHAVHAAKIVDVTVIDSKKYADP
jgi:hypothetical protein